jgi:hypothetical protein
MGYDRYPELLIDEKRRFSTTARGVRLYLTHDPGCALAEVASTPRAAMALPTMRGAGRRAAGRLTYPEVPTMRSTFVVAAVLCLTSAGLCFRMRRTTASRSRPTSSVTLASALAEPER